VCEMRIILIAGLWLTSDVWNGTATELARLGHDAVAVRLPGVDHGDRSATLDEQVDAVVAAIDDAAGAVVVVGHSAACTLAWIAADRRPQQVAHVVSIGGFPSSNGEAYADFVEHVDGAMPFPGWEPFDGPDSADLDDETKTMIAARAVPVPSAVARGVVRLDDEQPRRVPVTVVCPEFTTDQAQGWIAGGDVAELAEAADLRMVDIDSGHWPMLTRPVELARLLHEATT
jgi:pimeloyl-ACP methyl ester carboxylesterase